MIKSISIWSFGNTDIKSAMLLAKKAGFDAIELALSGEGELSLHTGDRELEAIKDFSLEIGLPVHSVASGLYWDVSFTSDDPDERRRAAEIAKKQFETAKKLGADAILVVPGAVKADFMAGKPVIPYDTAYDRALEAMSALKETAEALQIYLGIENVWNKFLLSPLEMRDFIDKIDSPYVGAYLDVGNIILTGYPEHWIRILGNRIKKVHFKDYRRDCGGLCGFVDLLSGDVDWKAVMNAFHEIGYDGAVTAEMIPPYHQYPEQIIFNTSASMDRILSRQPD